MTRLRHREVVRSLPTAWRSALAALDRPPVVQSIVVSGARARGAGPTGKEGDASRCSFSHKFFSVERQHSQARNRQTLPVTGPQGPSLPSSSGRPFYSSSHREDENGNFALVSEVCLTDESRVWSMLFRGDPGAKTVRRVPVLHGRPPPGAARFMPENGRSRACAWRCRANAEAWRRHPRDSWLGHAGTKASASIC